MIFQATWQAVLSGRKTITRRICKPGEIELVKPLPTDRVFFKHDKMYIYHRADETREITGVDYHDRKKWRVGQSLAVQPGRGQKAVGRIRLLEIRQERLQDITEAGAIAEGCRECTVLEGDWYSNTSPQIISAREVYEQIWYGLHTKRGERWDDNPLCWVLRFELVEDCM